MDHAKEAGDNKDTKHEDHLERSSGKKLVRDDEADEDDDDATDEMKDAPPVTLETDMTEVDISNKHLGLSGAIMAAAFLPKMT